MKDNIEEWLESTQDVEALRKMCKNMLRLSDLMAKALSDIQTVVETSAEELHSISDQPDWKIP